MSSEGMSNCFNGEVVVGWIDLRLRSELHLAPEA
jgi:hypothetical protein